MQILCHETRVDEHGRIFRQFTRRYVLPEGTESDQITSTLTPDGVVVIKAPRKRPEPILAENERLIPVKVVAAPEKQATTIPITKERYSKTDQKIPVGWAYRRR